MITWLFWLTLACALTDWIAAWRGWRRIRWLTKPGTLALLIAWFSQVGGWRGLLIWFGLGLVFSLLGDVLLHLPQRFFLGGMLAFFLAHMAYITGFVKQPLAFDWKIILPAVAIPIIYVLFIRRVRAGLKASRQSEMMGPVMGYAGFLSLMLFFAISTLFRPAWGLIPAVLVSLGAGLFYLSDACLAYNRFASPLPAASSGVTARLAGPASSGGGTPFRPPPAVPAADLLVMVTYHLGQILIAFGALAQFA